MSEETPIEQPPPEPAPEPLPSTPDLDLVFIIEESDQSPGIKITENFDE
ncbi:MAG: hypothetical protein H0U16_06425 [Actinobacteria bacterium]|nr:hypothetical protein [Actinomycetota bacterium]